MRSRFVFFLIGVYALLALTAFAGEFAGLQPGVSHKADADRVLGAPVREVVSGERYDYNPAKHDARRISIKFNRSTQVIETIDLYTKESYPGTQFREWFRLGEPGKKSLDANGNLIEYYLGEAIALYYQGPDSASPVVFFSHFDPNLRLESKPPSPAAGPAPVSAPAEKDKTAEGKLPFLGVILINHEEPGFKIFAVAPNSPAEKSGLRGDDVILQLGTERFDKRGLAPREFTAFTQKLPIQKPLDSLIKRGQQHLKMKITLEGIDPQELKDLQRRNKEIADSNYKLANQRMNARDYSSAIEPLRKAIYYNPQESFFYVELAHAYYGKADLDSAVPVLKKALILKPHYNSYYFLGVMYWKKKQYQEALFPLQESVRLWPAEARDPRAHELLGHTLFQIGRVEEALGAFVKAREINSRAPGTVYYIAACHDRLGNQKDAIFHYREYLRMKNPNPEMNKMAESRLQALTHPPAGRGDSYEKLHGLLDMFIQDWKEFNK